MNEYAERLKPFLSFCRENPVSGNPYTVSPA